MLVVTAPTANAATAVASQNTSDSDFNNAQTLSGVSVSGSGDSADVLYQRSTIDGFEDGDLSEWTENGNRAGDDYSTTTTESFEGSYSMTTSTDNEQIYRSVPTSNSRYSWAVRDSDVSASGSPKFELQTSGGTGASFIQIESGVIEVYDGSTFTTVASVSDSTWYKIVVSDIDYQAETLDVTVFDANGNELGSVNDYGFWNSVSDIERFSVIESTSNTIYVDTLKSSNGQGPGTYVGANHTADNVVEGQVNLSLTNTDATVTWEGYDGNSWSTLDQTTYSTGGIKTVSLSQTDKYRVNVTFESTGGSSTGRLHDEGIVADVSSPTLSNPEPADGSKITSYDGDISVALNDSDFGTVQGDSVTVTATNGSGGQIGQTIVSSNQTVTFSYSALAGDNNITWTASDSYGSPDASLLQNFTTPEILRIENESDPGTLITSSSTVTITAFGDSETVEKTTSDGTVNMSGFPADQRFVVQATADNYTERRVIIDSLFDQRTIYLLPTTTTSSQIEYILEDNSGNYPIGETELLISKPITINGNTTYQRVAGDEFGASGSVTFTLVEGDRYRLKIRNENGDTRTMGSYTVTGDSVEPLRITGVGIEPPESEGYFARVEIDDSGAQRNATFRYVDEAANTTDLQVTIHERGNTSNVAFQDSVSGPIANYSGYATLQNDTQYVVNWSAQRNGQQIGATRPIGGVDLGVDVPLDPQWAGTIGFVMLGFLAALGGERYGTQIAVVVVAFSGVLMGLRVIDIYPPFWWVAALIALGLHIKKKQQPGGV